VTSTAPSAAPVAETMAPSNAPVSSITGMPSFAPYSANTTVLGYLQYAYWDGAACNGTKTYISGLATDVCNPHSNGYGSFMVEFDDGKFMFVSLVCVCMFHMWFLIGFVSICFSDLSLLIFIF
jgi:hypothetical protein